VTKRYIECIERPARNRYKRKFNRSEEIKMLNIRLFNLLIAIALVIVVALTVREVFATGNIVSQTNATNGAMALECASLPSHYSIHTESVKETGTRLTYTEDGPTGIDGGLIYLLSSYRTCSR
jgi:hypothetical protein